MSTARLDMLRIDFVWVGLSMPKLLYPAVAAVLAAGCYTISFEDAPPGRYVVVTDNVIRSASPFPGGGMRGWMRVQLIVPEGTDRCSSGRTWPPLVAGPQRDAKPNAANELMLTIDPRATEAHFECRTPSGLVERTIGAVKLDKVPPCPSCARTIHEFPPIIHIGAPDSHADARWAALEQALCYDSRRVRLTTDQCRPDVFAMLKARDLKAS